MHWRHLALMIGPTIVTYTRTTIVTHTKLTTVTHTRMTTTIQTRPCTQAYKKVKSQYLNIMQNLVCIIRIQQIIHMVLIQSSSGLTDHHPIEANRPCATRQLTHTRIPGIYKHAPFWAVQCHSESPAASVAFPVSQPQPPNQILFLPAL